MQGYFFWLRNSMPFNDGFSEAWNGQCFVKWWVVLIAQRYFSAISDEYTQMCLLIATWNTDVINWFYSFHFRLQNPVSIVVCPFWLKIILQESCIFIELISNILTFYSKKFFPVSCLWYKYLTRVICNFYVTWREKKITFKDIAWKWAELHI